MNGEKQLLSIEKAASPLVSVEVRPSHNLVSDFAEYEYSSASFYESGIMQYENMIHVNDAISGKFPGSLPRTERSEKTPGEQ